MANSFTDGFNHPARAAERSDRIYDRPENMPDTGHILQQMTPDDRRAAHNRHDAGRRNDAADAALPRIQIINVEALDHTQVSMTPFDRNRSNTIGRHELQQTIGDPRMANNGSAGRIAVGLHRNFDAIASLDSSDGVGEISRSDMARFRALPPEHPLARQVTRDMNAVPGNGLNEGLFHPRDGVTPNAVRQSNQIDNSALMSSLSSLARHEPGRQRLLRTVQQDGNNFRVRLGNGQTITTPRPTSAEMGIYGQDSRNGIWPNVIERAVGMSMNEDPLRPQAAMEHLDGQEAVRALFGNRENQTHIQLHNLNEETLHTRLSNLTPNAMLMTADMGMNPSALAERLDRTGRTSSVQLNAGRTYEVERYDARARTVYLRDAQHETVRMSLNSFHRNFRTFNSVQSPQ